MIGHTINSTRVSGKLDISAKFDTFSRSMEKEEPQCVTVVSNLKCVQMLKISIFLACCF